MTQEELAIKAQLTVSTISRIERGNSSPRPNTVRSLAAALNVAPEDLLAIVQSGQLPL